MMRRREHIKVDDFWKIHKGEDQARPGARLGVDWNFWGSRGSQVEDYEMVTPLVVREGLR